MITSEYPKIYQPDDPKADASGYIFEHIFVAEQKVGRQLTSADHVHHLDSNPMNNDAYNLVVLTASQHSRIHNLMTRFGTVDRCVTCGKRTMHPSAPVCSPECIDNWGPDRDQLIHMWHTMPVVECGRQLGMSDNGFRKFCISKGIDIDQLPRFNYYPVPDIDEFGKILLDNDLEYARTAQMYGVTPSTVAKWNKVLGLFDRQIEFGHSKPAYYDLKMDIESDRHWSERKLAKKYNIPRDYLHQCLLEYRLKPRPSASEIVETCRQLGMAGAVKKFRISRKILLKWIIEYNLDASLDTI